jgi:hypothetical protein
MPKDVTEFGIISEVKDEHLEKHLSGKQVTSSFSSNV